jgi:hypothetical protein
MKLDEIVSTTFTVGSLIAIGMALSHCAYRDGASLQGSPAGLRAMFDGMNGMITNGKASPDQDTAHWQQRKAEDKELTIRNRDGRTMWQKIGAMMGKTSEVQ